MVTGLLFNQWLQICVNWIRSVKSLFKKSYVWFFLHNNNGQSNSQIKKLFYLK